MPFAASSVSRSVYVVPLANEIPNARSPGSPAATGPETAVKKPDHVGVVGTRAAMSEVVVAFGANAYSGAGVGGSSAASTTPGAVTPVSNAPEWPSPAAQ